MELCMQYGIYICICLASAETGAVFYQWLLDPFLRVPHLTPLPLTNTLHRTRTHHVILCHPSAWLTHTHTHTHQKGGRRRDGASLHGSPNNCSESFFALAEDLYSYL